MTSAAIAASVPSGARAGSMIAERSPSSGNSRYGIAAEAERVERVPQRLTEIVHGAALAAPEQLALDVVQRDVVERDARQRHAKTLENRLPLDGDLEIVAGSRGV